MSEWIPMSDEEAATERHPRIYDVYRRVRRTQPRLEIAGGMEGSEWQVAPDGRLRRESFRDRGWVMIVSPDGVELTAPDGNVVWLPDPGPVVRSDDAWVCASGAKTYQARA